MIKGKEAIEEYKKHKFDEVIKLLYNNFTDYFKSGDITITGSISYVKLGLIEPKYPKDLDLAIISGEYGDNIIYKLTDFLREQQDYKVTMRYWDEVSAYIKTPYGFIDILRDYRIYGENPIDLEIIDGVITKYHGHNWILNILIYKYKWFSQQDQTKGNFKVQTIKFKNLIYELYDITKNELNDDIINKINNLT